MKILVQVALSTFTGYGRDGIGLVQALSRTGADVYILPIAVDPGIPADIARILTKEARGPFDLYINHTDPGQLEAPKEIVSEATVSVGWTMWEWSNFDTLNTKSTLRKRLQGFDMILGYSHIDMDSLADYYDGPLRVLMGGYDPALWKYDHTREWDGPFRFLMHGQLSSRKSPFASIRAFSELYNEHKDFAQDARLSLHTTTPGVHSRVEDIYPGLRVFYESWDTETVLKFYSSGHILLAPSRGEGKNLPALEFMSTGGSVIATNWSGMRNWLSTEYAYPLDFKLTPADPAFPKSLSAQPNISHLKKLMLSTFRNREQVREKGKIASRTIPNMYNWDAVVGRLFDNIEKTIPDHGGHLKNLMGISRVEATRGG